MLLKWISLFGLLGAMTVGGASIPIGHIQGTVSTSADGASHRSPLENRVVEVQGLVHQMLSWTDSQGRAHYGVGIQNLPVEADGDPLSSDGILVYLGQKARVDFRGVATELVPGTRVRLRGKVVERFGQTEIHRPEFIHVSNGNALLKRLRHPVVSPPDSSEEAARFWERLEGMRVRLNAGAIVTGPTQVYGTADAQCWMIPSGHVIAQRQEPFGRRVFRDVHPLDDIGSEGFDNGNGFRIQLNSFGFGRDRRGQLQLLPPVPVGAALVETGSGMVLYGYGNYRVALNKLPEFSVGPDHRMNRPSSGASTSLRLATYNVENLYDHRDDPSDLCDAVGNPGTQNVSPPFNYLPSNEASYRDRIRRLARNIVSDLEAPDVLLLQELEDQDIQGVAGESDGDNDILADLSVEIRTTGGPRYRSLVHREGADERGITCGLLYRWDRLRPIDLAQDSVVEGARRLLETSSDLEFAFSPNNRVVAVQGWYREQDGSQARIFSRQVQLVGLQQVETAGPVLYLLNNHLSSRPDQRVTRRRAQAVANAQIAGAILEQSSTAEILIGGDLNVYPRPDDPFPNSPSDQLGSLYEVGLMPVLERLMQVDPASTYTYVYQGQAQILDHLFASPKVASRIASVWIPHINSDWPRTSRFPWKVSDHDPVVVDLK